MTINEIIGNNIKYYRLKEKITLEELAFRCDVNRNYLCDLENKRRNPTIKIIEKIANGLNIDIYLLFISHL